MKSFKNIENLLVAVDLSKYSDTVVMEAKLLSKELNVPMTLVYVFQDTEMLKSQFNIHKSEIVRYYSELIHIRYKLSAEIKVIVKFGRSHKQIIAEAKKLSSPLIIAGHRGVNPIVRFFLGSTVEKLALESPYPVWIHRGEKMVFPKKVLVPCDLSERSHRTVQQVQPLLKSFKATSELFHVEQEPMLILDFQSYSAFAEEIKKNEIRKLKQFRKKHPQLQVAIATGGIVNSIQKHSKDFDMIAVKPFFGDVTSKLIRTGQKPILITPN